MLKINVNEIEMEINHGMVAGQIRDKFKPDADIIILNGFPAHVGDSVHEGDKISLIKRGEIPTPEEIEKLILARNSPEIFKKLKNARIGIAGLGGLGSHIAMSLARAGVGFIRLVDYDVVEPSNLNRQCYDMSQIGMLKTDALKANITRAVNVTQIETINVLLTKDNIAEIFADLDAVAEAFDTPQAKTMLMETMTEKHPQTLLVCASGIAGLYPTELFQVKKLGKHCIIVGDFINEARKGQGLMAPRVSVAAGMQANIILRFITGEEI